MYHTMTIAGVQRDLPICKVSDDLYIGAFVIFGDVELTVKTAEALLKKAPEYDYMISAEAKGIPLIYEMARQSGQNKYFLARKAPKLYMSGVFDVKVNSITTAKEQHLYLDKADAELMRGKRILIVDDVISTGESLAAVEKLVEEAGALVVVDRFCFGSTPGREEIHLDPDLPVLESIARHYLTTSQCPRYMQREKVEGRWQLVRDLCEEYHAQGVLYEQLKFCEYWGYERALASHVITHDYGIPSVAVDRQNATGGNGQLRTRVQAFVESLEIKQLQAQRGGK